MLLRQQKIKDFPYLVCIDWDYCVETDVSDEHIQQQQAVFEDSLNHLNELGISHLMLVVSSDRRKEWYWYVSEVEDWLQKFNSALLDKHPFPLG